MSDLNTTSYAILGQLALQSWTTYALIDEMRRNFRFFYARAESGLYSEIKRLAKEGLVVGEKEYVGKRPRTIYTITPAGRAALEAWLASPITALALEFEGLLRIHLGNFTSPENLLNAVNQTQAEAEELIEVARHIRREYLAGQAPFQEHIHVRAFVFDFLRSFAWMVHDWAERTRTEIESWNRLSAAEREKRALQIFAEANDELS